MRLVGIQVAAFLLSAACGLASAAPPPANDSPIRLNTVGYLPNRPKRALVSAPCRRVRARPAPLTRNPYSAEPSRVPPATPTPQKTCSPAISPAEGTGNLLRRNSRRRPLARVPRRRRRLQRTLPPRDARHVPLAVRHRGAWRPRRQDLRPRRLPPRRRLARLRRRPTGTRAQILPRRLARRRRLQQVRRQRRRHRRLHAPRAGTTLALPSDRSPSACPSRAGTSPTSWRK